MPGIPLRPACSSDSVFDRSRKRWRWCFAERTSWRRDSLHRHIVTSASKLTIDLQSSRFTIHDSRFTIHDLTIHDLTIQRVSYPREEIIEQLIINLSTLGMVLHSKSEGIVAQSCLFDDVIGGAPRLHFETGAQFVNRLMMRAIHFFKGMARFAVGSERLDIVRLLIGQVMACDVEMESAAEGDIEDLQSFADRENRKPAFDRLLDGVEFPAIAIGIHILFDYRRIGNRLV